LQIINKLEGFPRVTPGMILTWKRPKPMSMKKMGRQVDKEFEEEVLAECEKESNRNLSSGGPSKSQNLCSHAYCPVFHVKVAWRSLK
jgi:hypothetical protein